MPMFQKQGYDLGKSGDGNDSEPMSEDDESEGEDLDDGGASGKVTLSGVAPGSPGKGAAPSKQKKFMPPIEVELQMQLLWKKEHKVLDLVFAAGRSNGSSGNGNANGVDSNGGAQGEVGGGYRLFFMRVIAVPPPRFRPPMDMGGIVAEHPQNVHLTKVCVGCVAESLAVAVFLFDGVSGRRKCLAPLVICNCVQSGGLNVIWVEGLGLLVRLSLQARFRKPYAVEF